MFWILCLLQTTMVMLETPDNIEDILAKYFSGNVYNKMVRGQFDLTEVTIVNMNFSLVSIDTFDEVKNSMDVLGVMYLSWKDERLKWNPKKYNGTQSVQVFQELIWRPRVILVNPSKRVGVPGFDHILTRCFYDGMVFWQTGDVFQIHCSADVRSFPFDRQSCGLSFNALDYKPTEVFLINASDTMLVDFYSDNGIWTLMETHVKSVAVNGYQFLEYTMIIERKATFFVVNILVPALLLGVLNLFVFLLPSESGERMSYSITVLLSIAVFLNLIGDHLPASSVNMAAICYLLFALLLNGALCCFCSILSLQLFYRKSSARIPWLLRKLSDVRCCASRKINKPVASESDVMNVDNDKNIPNSPGNSFHQTNSNSFNGMADQTWKHISNAFDRVCMFLLSGLFIFSICMYTYNVIEARKKYSKSS